MLKNNIINKRKNTIKAAISIVLIFIVITLGFNLYYYNKFFKNVYLAEVSLEGKTKDQALDELMSKPLPRNLKVIVGQASYDILTSEIDYSVDYKKSLDRVYGYTNSGNIINDQITKFVLLFKPKSFSLNINLNEAKLLESVLIISSKTGSKPIQPSAKIINGQVVVERGVDGIQIDEEEVVNQIKNELSNLKDRPINVEFKNIKAYLDDTEYQDYKLLVDKVKGSSIKLFVEPDGPPSHIEYQINDSTIASFVRYDKKLDEKSIRQEILEISKNINRNSQNSVFIVEDGLVKEFVPSKDGVTVDEDQLLNKIATSVNDILFGNQQPSIEIPVVKYPAKIKNEDVNNLGIKTLLGKGYSTFRGSIPNRIHNVNLAQSKFKGLLIPPGETVSFNNVLGDVSSFTGYKAAYVIKDGKTVLGDGGGVCQVSTTLFRAVLNAGLPVIERRAHAYRVGYYEQGFPPGLDATVYSPTTDFKFKNDTPSYILIQPTIDLNNLSLNFEIYGTSDGRISTVSKPVITSQSAPAEDLYIDDPTLPSGTIKQIEHKAWGAKVIFDYKVTRNNETLIDQRFVSNYRSWQAVYLKGTGQ